MFMKFIFALLFYACINTSVKADDDDDRPASWDHVVAHTHDFRFEHHRPDNSQTKDLFVAISDHRKECHVVEVAGSWEPSLHHHDSAGHIGKELYNMINGQVQEATLTMDQFMAFYNDGEVKEECAGYSVNVLQYTPTNPHHHHDDDDDD